MTARVEGLPRTAIGADAFAAGTTTTKVWWLSGAGFLLNVHGTVLLVDPVISTERYHPGFSELGFPLRRPLPLHASDVPRADAVLYTHNDEDHLAPRSARILARTGALFVGPPGRVQDTFRRLGLPPERCAAHVAGDVFTIGSVEISVTRADHPWQEVDPSIWGLPYGRGECCGYLFRTPEGTVWHPGDGRLLGEQLAVADPDVLLLDISEDPHHLGFRNAVVLANSHPRSLIVPHHYGTYVSDEGWCNADPELLVETVGEPERVRILAPGDSVELQREDA